MRSKIVKWGEIQKTEYSSGICISIHMYTDIWRKTVDQWFLLSIFIEQFPTITTRDNVEYILNGFFWYIL